MEGTGSSVTLTPDGVREVIRVAREGVEAKSRFAVVPIPGERKYAIVQTRADGSSSVVIEDQRPQRLDVEVLHVDEVAAAVKRFHAPEKTVVYYGPGEVLASIDGEGHGGRIRCKLEFERQYAELRALVDNSRPMDARQLRRWLRVTMSGCAESRKLLDWLAACSFSAKQETRTAQSLQRVSVGKDVESAAISAAGDLPEEMWFSVRVFTDPALMVRRTIKALIEVDPAAGTIEICPDRNDVQKVLDEELRGIGEFLRAGLDKLELTWVPVLLGTAHAE